MRARNIKPSFFTNDVLSECEPLARLMFAGLWTVADREGRLEDRPKKIKAEVLPYDNCDPDNLLSQLEKHGFILRYVSGNNKYIQILNFVKHQNPHVKEAASTIPAPDKPGASTVQNVPLPPSPIPHTESKEVRERDASAKPKLPKEPKISLEELSTDHNANWLAKKRSEGKYLKHDECHVLEVFKNYCKSKGKKYDDYLAAYRNAFEWDKCQPKQGFAGSITGKSNWTSAAEQIIAEDRLRAQSAGRA